MTVAEASADIPTVDQATAATPKRPYRLFGKVIYGRVHVCTRCRVSVETIEACEGAATPEEHDWIDPADYVCGECLDPEDAAIEEVPS